MSSLIERAVQRLDQLREAGIEVSYAGAPRRQPEPVPLRTLRAGSAPARDDAREVRVDLDALRSRGFVVPGTAHPQLLAQYRIAKRPLVRNAMSTLERGNLVMVTSAVAGEGKSFNAINLAISIAMELDHSVLLVDADVARPSLASTLGVTPGPGLLDLLQSKARLRDAVVRTNIERLSFLGAGTPHPHATELLASGAMRSLLDEMTRCYGDRIVVFDSPPLLLTTEARELAAHMGQVVLVVLADQTPLTQVKHALSAIEGSPVCQLLLNRTQVRSRPAYGYGIGDGYGYGYPYAVPGSRGGRSTAAP